MEQRTGRIDRVRSQTDRTLSGLTRPLLGDDMLQVYLPHLDNSVEVLQVQKVLERMNVFLRLMHEGLTPSPSEDRRIDVRREFARGHQYVAPISERLRSAFPVEARHLRGDVEQLAVEPSLAAAIESRFRALKQSALSGLVIDWEADIRPGVMLGTARLGVRQQPFSLLLRLCERHLLLHCISPVGRVNPLETDVQNEIVTSCARHAIRIGAIATDEDHSYDLTVEGDVLLGENAVTDSLRAGLLLNRVVRHADMLEQIQLRGRDEKLEAFRNDLEAEGHHGS